MIRGLIAAALLLAVSACAGRAPGPGGQLPNPAEQPPNPAAQAPNPAGQPPNPAGQPPNSPGQAPRPAGDTPNHTRNPAGPVPPQTGQSANPTGQAPSPGDAAARDFGVPPVTVDLSGHHIHLEWRGGALWSWRSVPPGKTALLRLNEQAGRFEEVAVTNFDIGHDITGVGTLSPDASVFWYNRRSPQGMDIMQVELANGRERVLAGKEQELLLALVPSPDGQHLAYLTMEGLKVMRRDGSARRLVAAGQGSDLPVLLGWAGDNLCWVDPALALHAYNAASGQSQQLGVKAADRYRVRLAQDGSLLGYQAQDLYLLAPPGGQAQRVAEGGPWTPYPAPGGRFLAYGGGAHAREHRELWLYDRRNAQARRLAAGAAPGAVAWAPDGSHLAWLEQAPGPDGIPAARPFTLPTRSPAR